MSAALLLQNFGMPHPNAPDPVSAQTDRAHVHWARPLIPRHPKSLADPIENVLAIVADCEPFERALATWESALNKGLVTLAGLAEIQ